MGIRRQWEWKGRGSETYLRGSRAGSMAEVVEHLLSKLEALSSNPSLTWVG
jgi:hypothetical protein